MPKRKEIIIDSTKIKSGTKEADYLRKLLDKMDSEGESSNATFKLTKTRGKIRFGKYRKKAGYQLDDDTTIHLKDFSLIRFPGSDRYYVMGKQIGKGGMGVVKVLPMYFKKSPDGGLIRYEEPDREEIIKILRGESKQKKDAAKEAQLAREAGGIEEAVSGSNPSGKQSGYAKMPKASGMDLEKYLLSHTEITLQERLKIIRLIMEELQKIRERGYFYMDIKPENIFYDGNKITFVDWGSAGKDETRRKTPSTPAFSSASSNDSNASQREAYALAGLVGVILSDFTNLQFYEQTNVIKEKYAAMPKKRKTYADAEPARQRDYDFSEITSGSFFLKPNTIEAKAFNALVDNLNDMGSQNVNKRDKISANNYEVFMDNLGKLELAWFRKLVNDLGAPLGKTYNEKDPKHKAIYALVDYYVKNDLANKGHLEPKEMKKFLELLGHVIEESARKQTGSIFGSNVLKTIKDNLPPEIYAQLKKSHKAQLNEYHSMGIFRIFKSKIPSEETKKKGQAKKILEPDRFNKR